MAAAAVTASTSHGRHLLATTALCRVATAAFTPRQRPFYTYRRPAERKPTASSPPPPPPLLRLDDGSTLLARVPAAPTRPSPAATAAATPTIDPAATASGVLAALAASRARRDAARAAARAASSSSSDAALDSPDDDLEAILPPRLRRAHPARAHLTPAQLQEMRTLREQDPDRWTVARLARRYDTLPGLVLAAAPCPAERSRWLRQARTDEFDRLSLSKKATLIDRARRRALW
ncbi:hypothetical protein HK405_015603 [Cladochytrium tenue]|nr:hypothetical protein HK405_015603 [Cladochytrium tenue]